MKMKGRKYLFLLTIESNHKNKARIAKKLIFVGAKYVNKISKLA